MGEQPIKTFTNKDLNKLPEGLTPVDDQLPEGLTPVDDNLSYKGPGTNPAADYLRADHNKVIPYTGSPHRQPVQAPPDESLGESLWKEANRPHLDLTQYADKLGNMLPGENTTNPHLARLRGFVQGGLHGLGDLASNMTSDLGLATLPAYLEGGVAGESVANAAKVLSPAAKAAGGAFALSGAKTALDPNNTLEQRLEAIPQIAGGIVPFLHRPVGVPTAASPLEQIGEAVSANEPPPEPQPIQSNFFKTTPEGEIDTTGNAVRPNRPPASTLTKKFNEPIKWQNPGGGVANATITNPADETFQGNMFEPNQWSNPNVPEQQTLKNISELEPKTQGNLDLQLARPTFSDALKERSMFPTEGGGLNEAPPEPKYGDENTPLSHAKDIVNSLPDAGGGKKVSPFPKVDDSVLDEMIRNKQVDYNNPRLEDVPLHNLLGTQDTITPEKVNEYVDAGDRPALTEVPETNKGRMDSEAPVVIRVGDENVLAGGHHRATADLANGKDTMQAVVYDAKVPQDLLDKFKASLDRDQAGRNYAAKPSNLNEPAEMAAKEGGKVGIGADIKALGGILGKSLYSGDVSRVATKELLQNSMDAIRPMNEKGNINITTKSHPHNTIQVKDNGPGMTKQELESVFTDLGASGKRNDESAIGGFGLAKAAPLLGGEHAEVTSVARHPDGKLYRTSFNGTPDELLEGVDMQHEEVPEGTPTGTSVKVKIPQDKMDNWAVKQYVKKLSENSEHPGEIALNGNTLDKFKGGKEVANLEGPSGNTKLIVPNDAAYGDHSELDIILRNKGMVQGHINRWIGQQVPNIPDKIIVDVDAKVPEGHEDYPWTANREALRGTTLEAVNRYIRENIIDPAKNAAKDKVQQAWDGMASYQQGRGPTIHLFDDKKFMNLEDLDAFQKSPEFNNIANISDTLIRSMVAQGPPEWGNRLQRTGITFDPGHYGVHVPDPSSEGKASGIFLNPFAHLINADGNPDEAAAGILHTLIHEVGHIEPMHFGDAHNADFAGRMAQIQTRLGVENTINALKNIQNIISVKGEYRPAITQLLQRYNEAIGRGPNAEPTLTSTGTESSTNRSTTGTEGLLSSDTGRSDESLGSKLTQEFNRPISGTQNKNASAFSQTAQTHPAESATNEVVNNIKTGIPQSEIPNRIANISDHLEEAKDKVGKDEKESIFRKARNFQRTLLTSYDLSAPGRQGLPLILNKAWWSAWKPMLQSWGSEGAYKNVMESIENDPSGLFKKQPRILKNGQPSVAPPQSFANRAGLDLTDTLSHREELFQSKWAEDYVPGVAPSVRAYTAYMNKLRADTFKSMVKAAGAENDIATAKKIADFINVATGRGNLGAFEGASKALAEVFFSPRLTASRVQMYARTLNPFYYASVPSVVRQAQLKSALATAGVGILMGQLAKNVGAEVNSDPTNTDFGKIKFGDTRIDPFAGHQQYLVGAARLLTGQATSSVTGKTHDLTTGKFGQPTRADVVSRFIEQKLAPVPSLVWSWLQGKDFDGTPFNLKQELANRTIPLAMQDVYHIWKNNPDTIPFYIAKQIGDSTNGRSTDTIPGLAASAASIGGFGVQTYGR